MSANDNDNEETQEKQGERHSCEDMSLVGCGNYVAFDIPSFYEESLNTSSMSASSNGKYRNTRTAAGRAPCPFCF